MSMRFSGGIPVRLLAVLSMFFSFALTAQGQSYVTAIGNPIFATELPMDGGYLDLGNGNLHLDISLSNPIQRGVTLSAFQELAYDGRIWQIVGTQWQPTNVPGSQAGWRLVSPTSGAISFTSTTIPCDSPPPIKNQWLNRWFTWTDPSGVVRSFNVHTMQQYTTNDPCYDSSQPGISSADGLAADGSGYHMYVTNYTSAVVYDRTGQQVYPKLEDRNGNYFSKDANGNLIDTLGNTPVVKTTSGSTTVYYDVLGFQNALKRYTVTLEQISVSTNFGVSGVSEYSGSLTAIQSIALPDSQGSYQFSYDGYGELASETLPSGGVITFGYTNYTDSFASMNRWLSSRVRDGATWTYTPAVTSPCSGGSCTQKVTVTTPGPSPDDTVYSFQLNGGAWNSAITRWKGSSATGGGGTQLQSTSTSYDFSNPCGTPGCTGAQYVRAINTFLTLDNGYTSAQSNTYDSSANGNVTKFKQWDFYTGAQPANPTVETDYAYGYTPNHAMPVVTQKTELSYPSGSSVIDAQETYGYDESSLASTPATMNHETLPTARGNKTSVAGWVNTSGSTLTTKYTFDDAGMQVTNVDPNPTMPVKTTTFAYNSNGSVATSVSLPTPSSGVAIGASASIDSYTGALQSTTDPNGKITNYVSYNWQLKPTEIDYPDSGKYTYASTPTSTSVKHYLSSTTYSDTETQLDGYGRMSRTAVANGQGTNPWYQVDYCYDVRGRLAFKSYSYQGAGWSAPKVCSGTSGDAYTYDSLDRQILVTHGDGTTVGTSYTGRAILTTDENSVMRVSQVDGLGRQTVVCEVSSSTLQGLSPVSCGTDITKTGFLTTYTYDLGAHKTTVTQAAQARVFQTDSISRSIFASEPERGSTSFTYTYNSTGLSVARVRPKANQTGSLQTTTTTQYDALSRPVSVIYDDSLTPSKTFYYDVSNTSQQWSTTPTNVVGRLVQTTSGSGATLTRDQFSYDSMGRVISLLQCAPLICATPNQATRPLSFTYDWAGNMLNSSDLTAGNISYGYSPANEITSITNLTFVDVTNTPHVASNVVNGPFGPLSYSLGNGLTGVNSYDIMGRHIGTWVCNGSTSANCTGGTQTFGNTATFKGSQKTSQFDSVVNQHLSYGYDEFNRLASQTVTQGTTQNFTYIYDVYGNRVQQNIVAGSGPSFGPISYQKNQASTLSYDAAGNVRNDGPHSYTYDAEGNVSNVDNGSTAQYVYDAMNHRIRTQTSAGVTDEYLYDMNGRRISRWIVSTNVGDEGRIFWGGRQVAYRASNARHSCSTKIFSDQSASARITRASLQPTMPSCRLATALRSISF